MQQRHAFLVETITDGRKHFKVVCDDPLLCEFFDHWSFKLSLKRRFNTVKAYADAVVTFLNYMFEVKEIRGQLTHVDLNDILDSFESYLVFGKDSDIVIASSAAINLNTTNQGSGTVSLYFTGLNNFLERSENLRKTIYSLQSRGIDTKINATDVPLGLISKIDTPAHVKKAIKESSWLSGCISGVVNRIKKKRLAVTVKISPIAYTDDFGGDEKTFPIDLAQKLIENAKNLRDKTLWSLLAACGCRISEAQTMLRSDVEINIMKDREGKLTVDKHVHIVDPATRKKELSRYLSESDINSLPHKGRADTKTFLIEPFASMFWDYYEKYLTQEKKRASERGIVSDHKFIFRLETNGDPVIDSYQTLYDSFSVAAKAITGNSYGFHSLRHMYGYYLKNFCPVRKGQKIHYGMSLKSVQRYMGHSEISSTQRYARDDAMKLSAAHAAMNMERNRSPNFSVLDAKIRFLENEIERLKDNKKKLSLEVKND